MLAFKNIWLGGALLTLLLVGTACCFARIWGISRRWKPLTFLLPLGVLGYFVCRGARLYYHDEPSIIIGLSLILFCVTALGALVATIVRKVRKVTVVATTHSHWASVVITLVAGVMLCGFTHVYRENDVLCARMQNRMLVADWEGIVDDALSAKRMFLLTLSPFASNE